MENTHEKIKDTVYRPSLNNFGMTKGYIDIDDENFPYVIEEWCFKKAKATKAARKRFARTQMTFAALAHFSAR
ncbi:hypothetical protein JCM19235_1318 [Vibrio maritimus]|uniref:Uncharacterized protein n=1 Tax=Vibrio maritimus TaxID=990268 RepID=A0A090SUN1_9VIBR|nr:hypothetical protein JCM19235_1318 [Vibrio maritimus]